MDHPFTQQITKELRGRVVTLLKEYAALVRRSDILFVCGGGDEDSLRERFRKYAGEHLPQFRVFFPEGAVDDYLESDRPDFVNLAAFESIVAELAECVVIFPEAPGACAELGYFSAKPEIAKKSLIVLDLNRQGTDSFISQGPVDAINQYSRFRPAIQISYEEPDFAPIAGRLERIKERKYRTKFEIGLYKETNYFQKMCVVHFLLHTYRILDIESLDFVFKSVFGHSSERELRLICSVLIGSGEFLRVGDLGHFMPGKDSVSFIELVGHDELVLEIRAEVIEVYKRFAPDLYALLKGVPDAY